MPELSLYDDAVVHYASSERFERISVSVEVDGNPRFSPDEITDDIASYLSQFNIQYVPRDDDQISGAAHLDLKFVRNGQLYSIDSMLTAADGRLVENVTLYHDAGNSDTKATQQQLASLVIELITNVVLVGILVILGPLIKRFGRAYAGDVFRANPRTGKSYLVLMDVAYYLIFTAYILFTIRFEPQLGWERSVAAQLQDEVVRVAGMLLLMGILHGLNVLSLPLIGRLLGMSRQLEEDTPATSR